MKIINLTAEPVELYKILKFEGLCASGGEAKAVISDGEVLVNGVIETKKRKKIVAGDIIDFNEEKYQIKRI
jgi:ribosome-associated protein